MAPMALTIVSPVLVEHHTLTIAAAWRIVQQDMGQMALTTVSLVLEVPTLIIISALELAQLDGARLTVPMLVLSVQEALQFLIITCV